MFELNWCFVVLLLVTSIDISFQNGHRTNPTKWNTYKCEPLIVNYCMQLGYNSTVMPNMLNHVNQQEAASALSQYYTLFLEDCSPDLAFLVCSIYMPACNTLGRPIPPCKSVCMSVSRGCEATIKLYELDWPEVFDCNRFPENTTEDGVECLKRIETMEMKEVKASSKNYDGTLVYSNENHIESLSISDSNIQTSKIPLILHSVLMKRAAGLAIDYESGAIIYGDRYEQTINSVFFNGSRHLVLARDQGDVIWMEFNSARRTLYWVFESTFSHSAIKYIELTKQGTRATNVKTLLEIPLLAYLTGIAVDDCGQNIFWGQRSVLHGTAIFKINLVDFGKETVISTEIISPIALTVDQDTRQLYWSDRWLYKIERCDFDGRHRVVIAQGDDAASVYGMTIYGDYLYWTEERTETLYRANKFNGEDLIVVENYLKDPMDVVVIVNNTNQCIKNSV